MLGWDLQPERQPILVQPLCSRLIQLGQLRIMHHLRAWDIHHHPDSNWLYSLFAWVVHDLVLRNPMYLLFCWQLFIGWVQPLPALPSWSSERRSGWIVHKLHIRLLRIQCINLLTLLSGILQWVAGDAMLNMLCGNISERINLDLPQLLCGHVFQLINDRLCDVRAWISGRARSRLMQSLPQQQYRNSGWCQLRVCSWLLF